MTDVDRPLLHICYAPTDRGWVHGRMVCELGLEAGQYRTREDARAVRGGAGATRRARRPDVAPPHPRARLRDPDKAHLVQRIRAGHGRILVVGPSGSGKSSLIHAAVLPELAPRDHVVQVVPRGDYLAAALSDTVDALEVPELGAAIDAYVRPSAARRGHDR